MNVRHVRGVAEALRALSASRARGRDTAVAKKKLVIPRQKLWRKRPEILLGPPIPEPMHGMAPRVVLGASWWNKTRQEAYKSTAYHCVACGVFKTDAKGRRWLEAHEVYETDYLLGRMVYVEAVPLCHYCHNYCHPGRMRALLEKGEMTHAKYAAVVQYGEAVLRAAKLKLPDRNALNCKETNYTEPDDWRLVIDGVEYARSDYVQSR